MSGNQMRGRAPVSRTVAVAAMLVLVLGLASFVAERAWPAPIYIQMIGISGKIAGESKDAAHMNWISVSSVVAGDLNGDAMADRESSAPSVSEVTKANAAPKANIGSQSSGAGAGKVVAPRDAASGMASGKRMHKPFVIMREVDKASPMLMKACASGEHFKTVEIDDVSNGRTVHYVLSDVVISSVKMSSGGDRPMESFSFTYQKIEMK